MEYNAIPTGKKRSIREYEKSFLVLLLLLTAGILLEIITPGNEINLPQFPYSAYMGIGFIIFLTIIYFNYRKTRIISWLTSVPAALSAISGLLISLILINIIPQNTDNILLQKTGLTHLQSGFIFLFVNIYLLTILGFTIYKYIIPFNWRKLSLYFSHTGLWIIIASIGLGSTDIQKLTINLLENGKESDIGISQSDEMVKLPYTFKLNDFTLDEYPPKIIIVKNGIKKTEALPFKSNTHLANNSLFRYKNLFLYIKQYLPHAIYNDSIYIISDIPGSFPAISLDIVDIKKKIMRSGWISTGNLYIQPQLIHIDSSTFIQLEQPKIKNFYSSINITDSLHSITENISSEKPLKLNNWFLYHSGYDYSKGKWSTLGVFKLIKDPWIKLIYIGVSMLVVGIILMFWTKKRLINE